MEKEQIQIKKLLIEVSRFFASNPNFVGSSTLILKMLSLLMQNWGRLSNALF